MQNVEFWILYSGVGAPRSTHYSRMIRSASLYEKIVSGNIIPDKGIALRDFENIHLVTIGDIAFPKHASSAKKLQRRYTWSWTKILQHKALRCACVTENACGMMKGRFIILHKKTECRLKNLKYVIMACVMMHNLCISVQDPCLPSWRLQVKQLLLIRKACERK